MSDGSAESEDSSKRSPVRHGKASQSPASNRLIQDYEGAGVLWRAVQPSPVFLDSDLVGFESVEPRVVPEHGDPAEGTASKEEAEVFWQQQLGDSAEPRLFRQSRGRREERRKFRAMFVDQNLGRLMRALCTQLNQPPLLVLLTGIRALLCRLTRDTHLSILSPVHAGGGSESFTNLPIRTEVSGALGFVELTHREAQALATAIQNSLIPLHRIRDLAGLPIRIGVQESRGSVAELRLEPHLTVRNDFALDLDICLLRGGSELGLALAYDESAFAELPMSAFLAHFQTLLRGASASPDLALSHLRLLSEAEEAQVLDSVSRGPRRPSPSSLSLIQRFEDQVQLRPHRVAITDGAHELSYAELHKAGRGLAAHLRRLVGPEELFVAILLPQGKAFVTAMLATLMSGKAYAPLSPVQSPGQTEAMLQELGHPLLITVQVGTENLNLDPARTIYLDDPCWDTPSEPAPTQSVPTQPTDLVYCICSSGTTGRPKPILIEHGSVLNFVDWMVREWGVVAEDCSLLACSPAFDVCVSETWPYLTTGARLCVPPPAALLDMPVLADFIRTHGVTTMSTTTALVSGFLALPPAHLPPLRFLCTIGEKLLSQPPPGLPFPVYNAYGPTEATVWCTTALLRPGPGTPPIGRPMANVDVFVLDELLRPLPIGVVGEIFIGGAGVGRGYHNLQDTTALKFVQSPFGTDRLYRTGDLGYFRPDGNLMYCERMDEQVKVRGFRLELLEIEAVLVRHGHIGQAAVTLDAEKQVVAYCVGRTEALPSLESVEQWVQQSLPYYAWPRLYTFLPRLPLNAVGKVAKRVLSSVHGTVLRPLAHPLETETQAVIAHVWAQVLGLEEAGLGRDSNLFRLGATSGLIPQILQRLALRLPAVRSLPPFTLFLQPTIAQLAAAIQAVGPDLPTPPATPTAPGLRLPFSFQQEQVWIHKMQLGPTGVYNTHHALRLEPGFSQDEVRRALGAVLESSPTLRGVMDVEGDSAGFRVLPVTPVDLLDLSNDPRSLSAQLALEADYIRDTRFELSRGPLLRFLITRGEDGSGRLCSVAHHLLMDALSWELFDQRLQTALTGLPIDPEPGSYTDFAYEQRARDLRALERFWANRLEKLVPAVLPEASNQLSPPHGRTRYELYRVPDAVLQRIGSVCRAEGTVPFSVLLTGLKAIIARYTGSEDVTVVSVGSGRSGLELETRLGHFACLMAVRSEMRAEAGFLELLRHVHSRLVEAMAHQEFPFQRLLTTSSALKALLSLLVQMSPSPPAHAHDLLNYVRSCPRDWPTGFQSTIEFFTDATTLTALVSSAQPEALVFQLLPQLFTLLENALSEPTMPIKSVPLLGPAEVAELLGRAGASPWPRPPAQHQSLLSGFARQVVERPGAVAVVENGLEWTYAELDGRSSGIAAELLERESSAFVAILLPSSTQFVLCMLAAGKGGKTYVPLNTLHSPRQLREQLAEFQNPVLLTTRAALAETRLHYVRCLFVEDVGSGPAVPPLPRPQALYVIFTSGSTGRPKGVLVGEGAVVNLLNWMVAEYEVRPEDRSLVFHSPAADAYVVETWPYLMSGARLHIPDAAARYDVDYLKRCVSRDAITALDTTTEVGRRFLSSDCSTLTTLRHLTLGGEKLAHNPLTHAPALPFKVYHAYGPTEAAVTAVTCQLRPLMRRPPLGYPVNNVEIYVLDAQLRPLPPGLTGEIHIGGAGLALGYHNRPERTAERFIANSFGSGHLYKTGDLGSWFLDGTLLYSERLDEQVKVRGFRIELGEVEAAIERHAYIGRAAVMLEQDSLVAYCVSTSPDRLDLSELQAFLELELPYYALPSAFFLLGALPLGPVGKVDRKALLGSGRRLEPSQRAAPLSATEQVVAGVWADVLALPLSAIRAQDSFFALGGNSLMMTQVQRGLETLLARPVPFRLLFDHSRLEAIATLLDAPHSVQSPSSDLDLPDFELEAHLPPIRFPLPSSSRTSLGLCFLTGATGYLGAALLHHLLIHTSSPVVCLVRATDDATATGRVLEAMREQDAHGAESLPEGRLRCLAANVSTSKFGLDVTTYACLAENVQTVFHCAAEVNFFKNYRDLKGSNVDGTREVLLFVAAGAYKVLHHVSTLGVLGRRPLAEPASERSSEEEAVLERSLLEEPRLPAHNDIGYTQSKYVAERLVWHAVAMGCPAVIHRVGTIGAHSQRRAVNRKDFLAFLTKAAKRVGSFPAIPGHAQYSTLEFTCEAMVGLAQEAEEHLGQVFHLFQDSVSYSSLLGQATGTEEGMEVGSWTRVLRESLRADEAADFYLLQILPQPSAYDGLSLLDIEAELDLDYSRSNTRRALPHSQLQVRGPDLRRYSDLL